MQALKVTQIGNSLGVILPKEVLARLKVEKGDQLFMTEAPDGYRVSNTDPEFAVQMKAAQDIMRKRRNVLRELAK
jgi:putative addiction module antidote